MEKIMVAASVASAIVAAVGFKIASCL